ncbi:MAG TPA: hypothetical protein VGM91_00735 [Conexibacter sp.]|jgi:hypothetical protein
MRVSRTALKAAATTAATAAAALLVLAPSAGATTRVAVTGAVTPAITGFPTTPQNVKLTMEGRVIGDDIDGVFPATSTKIVLSFTHGARVNGALFPSCDPRRLRLKRLAPGSCPKGSKIGSGWAYGTSISVTTRLAMNVYNGAGGKTMIFTFQAVRPVNIDDLIVAPFEHLHGNHDYGFRITLPVPPSLQELSPGLVTSLRQFRATVGGTTVTVRDHGRKVRRGFIEAMTCPPGALVITHGVFSFRDAPDATDDAYLGCGVAPPFPPDFPSPQLGSS